MNIIIIVFIILHLIFLHKYLINLTVKNLIEMYKKATCSVNIIIREGLGNRLMSFAGIIMLSIYYEYKPFCIIINNIHSINVG